MPTTKPASPKEDKALVDTKKLEEIRRFGGASETAQRLPIFSLEHTTISGEANPLKGHFTLSTRNDLGDWQKKDLGESVDLLFLVQRYRMSCIDGDERYSSPEFDSPQESVKLFKSTGQGDDRKSELYSEGTFNELSGKFIVKEKDRTYSKLRLQFVLYALLGEEIVTWRCNVSATMGFRKFGRDYNPYGIITNITAQEVVKGSNKFYRPVFKVKERFNDLEKILKLQKELRQAFDATKEPEKEEAVPFD